MNVVQVWKIPDPDNSWDHEDEFSERGIYPTGELMGQFWSHEDADERIELLRERSPSDRFGDGMDDAPYKFIKQESRIEGLPPFIESAERVFVDWATSNPLDCCDDDYKHFELEDRINIIAKELQYHLGSVNAAHSICNSLYKDAGIDDRYVNMHREQTHPWLKDCVEEMNRLEEELEVEHEEWR